MRRVEVLATVPDAPDDGQRLALARTVAVLQGMLYELHAAGASRVGAYSTSYQWGQIAGMTSLGTLSGIPDWVSYASTLSAAMANCKLAPFTGGRVTVTQWFGRGLDGDYAC